MIIYIKTKQGKYYRANVSQKWAEAHDNGALVSCGWEAMTRADENEVAVLIQRKHAVEVTRDEYNHSGCQSACVLRGDKTCTW